MASSPSPSDDLVWYASYGSNIRLERFLCYLQGGTPEGGLVRCEGARDATAPRDALPIAIHLPMYFAQFGRRWAGAVAFIDIEQYEEEAEEGVEEDGEKATTTRQTDLPLFEVLSSSSLFPPSSSSTSTSTTASSASTKASLKHHAYGRMYLITREQFNDLVAQENFVPEFEVVQPPVSYPSHHTHKIHTHTHPERERHTPTPTPTRLNTPTRMQTPTRIHTHPPTHTHTHVRKTCGLANSNQCSPFHTTPPTAQHRNHPRAPQPLRLLPAAVVRSGAVSRPASLPSGGVIHRAQPELRACTSPQHGVLAHDRPRPT
jgi:hypothetical protein